MTIEVEERAEKPGRCVAVANIGAALAVFAIHVDGGEVHYYIEDVEVPRQAYVDAMKTAELVHGRGRGGQRARRLLILGCTGHRQGFSWR